MLLGGCYESWVQNDQAMSLVRCIYSLRRKSLFVTERIAHCQYKLLDLFVPSFFFLIEFSFSVLQEVILISSKVHLSANKHFWLLVNYRKVE